VLNTGDGVREEIDLRAPGRRVEGESYDVMPDPVGSMIEEETDGDEARGAKERTEERYEEEAAISWERGGETSGGGDPGGDERGTGSGPGVGGSGDLVDEVLRAGGESDSGDGEGVGTPSPWEEDGIAGRCDSEGGEGAGPSEEGFGSIPGVASSSEEEHAADGAVETWEKTPEPEYSPEEDKRDAQDSGPDSFDITDGYE